MSEDWKKTIMDAAAEVGQPAVNPITECMLSFARQKLLPPLQFLEDHSNFTIEQTARMSKRGLLFDTNIGKISISMVGGERVPETKVKDIYIIYPIGYEVFRPKKNETIDDFVNRFLRRITVIIKNDPAMELDLRDAIDWKPTSSKPFTFNRA